MVNNSIFLKILITIHLLLLIGVFADTTTITVSRPLQGEEFIEGERLELSYEINTSSPIYGKIGHKSIYLSEDGGNSYSLIDSSTGNIGHQTSTSFHGSVSDTISSNMCKFKISIDQVQGSNDCGLGYSELFCIVDTTKPLVSLYPIPNPLQGGVGYTIKWNQTDNIKVIMATVSFYENSAWTELGTVSDSLFDWSVPNYNKPNCYLKVTVYDANGNFATDTSYMFNIIENISIKNILVDFKNEINSAPFEYYTLSGKKIKELKEISAGIYIKRFKNTTSILDLRYINKLKKR